ncbi:MAG TPA: guanylate kinase, partial [Phototrophicaceae bacterium]|nr:guanylate kinase [Phototrophicaceae bacterium]
MSTPQPRQGLLFILIGPPGVGKNALMNAVLARVNNLKQLPTATTRAIRPTEQPGREHLFVTRDEFQQLITDRALIEWQVVHGELYGMPRATVEEAITQEHDLIADIDVLGATYLRSLYPDNAVLIFIQPPSLDALKKRMETRGEKPEEIAKRLRRVDMEMQYAPLCDYLIINADLDEASEILYAIVLAERSRRALLNLRVERDLPRHKFTYMTTVIPVHNGEVLCRDGEPHFPTIPITQGE